MKHLFAILDAFIILVITCFSLVLSGLEFNIAFYISVITLTVGLSVLFIKQIYQKDKFVFKDYLKIFEALATTYTLISMPLLFSYNYKLLVIIMIFSCMSSFFIMLFTRLLINFFNNRFKRVQNVLIVGAGQDGKLIADEILKRPDLKLNVVGFLDDNMNTIEDQDANIRILGLTCDSEAVIKDNNVKLVIVAVKSRMDSDILTDLVKGIPLGVKVWRMYRFYEKISKKFLVSKMSVNWLFYDCVRKKALIYSYLKRVCDVLASIVILVLTLPLSIFAAIGIKISDFEGPVFFMQNRIGKFGQSFKMIKFRTMYQDRVEDNFDDDLSEITSNDKRIMPFGKILRKFHIDEIPQMINVLRGEMSIVGPRPLREEVYEENKENIPFWECRHWVRPGWCGWQQLKIKEPVAEQRIGYDLYYIKHQNLLWDISIFFRYVCKVLVGQARGK